MIFRDVQFQSVAEVEDRPDGSVLMKRVPEFVRMRLNDHAQQMMLISGNNEIRFVADGDEVSITLSAAFTDVMNDEDTVVKAEVFWGEFQTQQVLTIGEDPTTLVIKKDPCLKALPDRFCKQSRFSKDVCRIRIGMVSACLVFHGIQGEGVRPPLQAELPARTLLTYGTSITHGCASSYPHLNYVSVCARQLGLDLINLGSGGSAQCEPELAQYIAERGKAGDWDIASLELSVNMIYRPVDYFYEQTTRFVKIIAEANPDKPIFCITLFPFFADIGVDLSTIEGHPQFGKKKVVNNNKFRASLSKTVSSLALPNVYLVEGKEMLSNINGLTSDLIHPGDYGHIEMGQFLAGKMAEHISFW
jgi:lysophospholipase L1-like esterase